MIAIMPAARNPARSTESVTPRRIAEGLEDSEAVVEHDAAPVLALVDQHAADLRAVELQPELELCKKGDDSIIISTVITGTEFQKRERARGSLGRG